MASYDGALSTGSDAGGKFLCLLLCRLLQLSNRYTHLWQRAAPGIWYSPGIGALVTLCTGVIAVWHLQLHGGAQYSVSRHMIWAVCTSQLVVLLGLWRAFGNNIERTP